MALDGHIHIDSGMPDREGLLQQMNGAGISGGVLLSLPPASFLTDQPAIPAPQRLDNLLTWCQDSPTLYPFFWIDPTEPDALNQATMAIERQVAGFKIICDRFYPGDERALPVYRAIARANRPILFHSGILWDGKPSSKYNRPVEFEALLAIDGLRFALAHISWPWYDELIAVYGKFQNALRRRSELSVELFIDTTPGTPPIYRQEALSRLFTVGYNVQHNVFFGSDATANTYNGAWVQRWIQRDQEILGNLGLSEEALTDVFQDNLRRFLGQSPTLAAKQP